MTSIRRRDFLGRTMAVAGAAAISGAALAQDPYDLLIGGQYANSVTFIAQAAGQYFGDNFTLSPSQPVRWQLRLGRYSGRYQGHAVDLHGYWIFHPDGRRCWQAVKRGNGPLAFWNQDRKAGGGPEDWELFSFAAVSKNDKTVKIYNTS